MILELLYARCRSAKRVRGQLVLSQTDNQQALDSYVENLE